MIAKLKATLYDPASRERVVCSIEDEVENVAWMWTEGNYSCDCNKRLFMSRAKGIEPPLPWTFPCGDKVVLESLTLDGEYRTPHLVLPSGFDLLGEGDQW